jgi:lipopolysaccharide export system permease protein
VRLTLAGRLTWPVAAGLEEFVREDKPVETQSMAELREAIRSLRLAGKDFNEELVFYYFKWAFPCASFIVALLGLGIAFAFQTSPREGPAKAFGVASFAAAGYIGLIQFGQALGVGGVLPAPLAAWLANIVFLTAGLVLLRRGWR